MSEDTTDVATEVSVPSTEESTAEVSTPVAQAGSDDEGTKVYIGNLSFDESSDSVKELFVAHGAVSDVYMPTNRETGKGRGFCFVTMSNPEDAQKAIAALDNTTIGGRPVFVNLAGTEAKPRKKTRDEDPKKTKLYVGNISFETNAEALIKHFSQFGKVYDCYIPTFPEGNPRGFAFITLDSEVADRAVEASDGMEYGGRSMAVSKSLTPQEKKKAKSPGTRVKSMKIYIGNLSYETDEETLKPIFEELGTVTDFYMPMDDAYPGQNRGFAFCTMPSEDAKRSIEELDGLEIDGRIIRVNAAKDKAKKQNPRDNQDGGDYW